MLLSNYGRDQMGESFDGSQQAPLLHPVVQSSLADVSSPNSSLATTVKPPPTDQMLAAACQRPGQQERRLKPHSDQVLKCPRCDSMNTKFCYYNNYSLTQPRHFCKNCKRYWTKGGALRNVPVGGGCRKNKRVKQRQQDSHPQAPSASSDELASSAPGSLANDGASSSSILQQEFPATSNSASLYEVPKGSNGMSLPFDRVEQVPRIFPGGNNNPPISINWAGQIAGVPLGNSQQYDPSILGLNLPAPIKQEPVHGADMNTMFDHSLGMATHAPGTMNEGLNSYVPIENFGLNGAAGEMLWRFPQQPKLVSLLEDGNEQDNSRHGLLDLEAGGAAVAAAEKLKHHKGKSSGESMQVSSDYDQQADSSSPEWQPTSDGFFESGGETGYWSNGGWSSELHSYGGGQTTGSHQML